MNLPLPRCLTCGYARGEGGLLELKEIAAWLRREHPNDDPDASLVYYHDTLGFEVRNDVGCGGMRWITIGPTDRPVPTLARSRKRRS